MTQNVRQYYLDAMGIDCWILKSAAGVNALDSMEHQYITTSEADTTDILIVADELELTEHQEHRVTKQQVATMLDKMLTSIGLDNAKVNIVTLKKCNCACTHNNELNVDSQEGACQYHLKQQVNRLKPRVILALGDVVANHLLAGNQSFSQLRQNPYTINESVIIVTYKPADLIIKPDNKKNAYQDIAQLLPFVTGALH